MQSAPLEDVSKPRKSEKLPKAICPDELEQLCRALRDDYKDKLKRNVIEEGCMIWRIPLFWFGLYTGLRASELARLRWSHIDFERGLIIILKQKNHKEQTIPLNRKAREVLDEVPEGDENDFIFQSPTFDGRERSTRCFRERASRAFRNARNDAELREEISLHSLRHGFCTLLAEAGKSAVVIKEAARHADIQTSMRYVHMANETLKSEIEDAFIV